MKINFSAQPKQKSFPLASALTVIYNKHITDFSEEKNMKFIHLSDLHIGKRVNEFSMTEDQKHILSEIAGIVKRVMPDAVIIAGDVYDKTVPPAEAVQIFDDFLHSLKEAGVKVFVISGNHDSPERIAFGSRIMQPCGIYMSQVYDGTLEPIILNDEFGEVAVYMLPFIKPLHVRKFFPDAVLESYTDAIRTALDAAKVDTGRRNVLITHQFITGASRSESEEISVGGSDNVDVSVFDLFDYVALGHIHGAQSVGRDTVRYCGTPLKYSFSEAGQEKSVTVVELSHKGKCKIDEIPLTPLRDMRKVRGEFSELISGRKTEDYMQLTLTDEDDIPDAVNKLRSVYPNLMSLNYDNTRTRHSESVRAIEEIKNKEPIELFAEFFAKQNGADMSEEQYSFAKKLFESISDSGEERMQ